MVNAQLAESEIDGEDIEAIHVYPQFGKPHKIKSDCWCHPTVEYCACGCGAEVIVVHNVAH